MRVSTAPTRTRSPIWDIVEETLEEALFLWSRWRAMLWSHAYGVQGVSFWVEERLLGALDGILGAGKAAADSLLIPALRGEDILGTTVAAHVLAADGGPRALEALMTAFRESDGARLTALEQGLALVRSKSLSAALDTAVGGASSKHAASAMRVRAFQQRDPGPDVEIALESEDIELRTATLRAFRHTASVGGAVAVERQLYSADCLVRDTAIETGLVRGMAASWSRCREVASLAKPDSGRALVLLALLGVEQDQKPVVEAVGDEKQRRDALFALGFAGTRAAADACIEAMAAGLCVQLAGEAFAAITGLDLEAEGLVAPNPSEEPDEPIPFEEENLDANLVPTPADLLPWPDVGGVIRWWNVNRAAFAGGQRYLGGKPADLTAMQRALAEGPMRRRHAIALELAIRTGGRYQVETLDFTAAQRRQMEAFELFGGAGIRRSRLKQSFSSA